jgi:hypothetical protein
MAGVAAADTRITISSSVAADAGIDPSAREASAALVKQALGRALPATTIAHHVDISISSVAVVIDDQQVSVTASMRIAVADRTGTLLSVMSGGARVEVPNAAYRSFKLPAMQRDALLGAVESLAPKIATLLVGDSPAEDPPRTKLLIQLTDMARLRALPVPMPTF